MYPNKLLAAIFLILVSTSPVLAYNHNFKNHGVDYFPHYVQFRIISNDSPVQDANVSIRLADKERDSIDYWIAALFGIYPHAPVVCAELTHTTTDKNGEFVVILYQMIKYNITITKGERVRTFMLYPFDSDYNVEW